MREWVDEDQAHVSIAHVWAAGRLSACAAPAGRAARSSAVLATLLERACDRVQLLRITPEFDPGGSCVRRQIRLDLHEVVGAPSTSKPRGVLEDGLQR